MGNVQRKAFHNMGKWINENVLRVFDKMLQRLWRQRWRLQLYIEDLKLQHSWFQQVYFRKVDDGTAAAA